MTARCTDNLTLVTTHRDPSIEGRSRDRPMLSLDSAMYREFDTFNGGAVT